MGETTSKRVVILGAGRVATHLAPALIGAGYRVVQVWSRTEVSARSLAVPLGISYTSQLDSVVTDADIYILCVSDAALPEVAKSIVNRVGTVPLFLHTAGSVGLELWKHCGASCYGILYPLQTFSKECGVDMSKVPFFVEGSDEGSLKIVESLAYRLSDKVFRADSKRRARLHIAAVFACNFTNAMYDVAYRLLAEEGIPFEVLLPLIEETASKVHRLPPCEAQTGPAARGDSVVMKSHMQSLKEEQDLNDIYALISNYIMKHR